MTTTRDEMRPCLRKLSKPVIIAIVIAYLPILIVACIIHGLVLGFLCAIDIWKHDITCAWSLDNDK